MEFHGKVPIIAVGYHAEIHDAKPQIAHFHSTLLKEERWLDDKCYEAGRICFPVNSITDCTLTQTHDDCISGWIIFHFLLLKLRIDQGFSD